MRMRRAMFEPHSLSACCVLGTPLGVEVQGEPKPSSCLQERCGAYIPVNHL